VFIFCFIQRTHKTWTKCSKSPRLETRTKECNVYVSFLDQMKPKSVRKLNEVGFLFKNGKHHRPIGIFGNRFECEHIRCDPKDGELCLSRVKSGETLMEARSGSNVQIDRQTWV